MKSTKQLKAILAVFIVVMLMAAPITPSVSVFAESADDFVPTPNYIFQDDQADAGARLDDILSRMTLDEKVTRAKGNGAIARLNLNSGRGGSGEGLHGVAWEGQATMFPNSLGLSQTWDRQLLSDIGDVIAKESLANGVTSAGRLAPVVDLLRDPRYGRAYETMGEDAYLVGSLGTALAEGMNQRTEEGYQQFIPILKHFMAYGAEINRLWVPSSLFPRSTNEYYVKAFKYPVSAGASKSLMNSYPVVNGKPMSINPLQRDLLFDWTPDYPGTGHYEYTTMNDYGSGSSIFVHSQRYMSDDALGRALGIAQGIKNGQMAWSFRSYGSFSTTGMEYEALARGMADEKDYEEVARRSLAMQLRLGDMDQLGLKNPYLINPVARYGANRAAQMALNKGLSLQASQEQMVLLKNDGVLPLSGSGTSKAILLGPQGDQILKDFYSGSYKYRVTIKDALENKLGQSNLFFNRAIDSVAIKSVSTGRYLTGGTSATYTASGTGGNAVVSVTGTTKPTSVNDEANRNAIFEIYDYGSANWLLRTPINGRYVQVNGGGSAATPQNLASRMMYNNTSAPAEGNLNETASGQNLTYSNYQKFRLIPTTDGHMAIYHLLSGDGINGGTPLAYDVDDEDINRGSYLYANASDRVVPDVVRTNGPWQTEYNVTSPVDTVADDGKLDNLPDDSFKFDFESIQSVEESAAATIAAANDPTAPVILVVGYEPHMNSREGIDLYKTGLSAQQMRLINYVTNTLARDVILLVKTGNPMTFDKTVTDNPKVKAILLMGQTGQEEGAAVVSALFDDGYTVPETGWAPANTGQFTMNTGMGTNGPNQPFPSYPGYLPDDGSRKIDAYAPAGRLSATWYDGIDQMIGASEEHPPASYMYPAYDEETNDNLSNMNGTIPTGLLVYDNIKGERTYQYLNKTPHYAFGYGLTYTTFTYDSLVVGPVSGNTFTVSGSVTNTGSRTSDEVVQIYSTFEGTPSRIKQPNLKLIAYDRLKDIAPDETRSYSFTIDLTDKLGVWDVETEMEIVESGNYRIKAAPSSDASPISAVLSVSGPATAKRNLSKLTLAENFDDYSNVTGTVQDVENVSASIEYEANNAVQFRANGAWLAFKDTVFTQAPTRLTIKAGSDRTGKLSVYALPAGTDPAALSTATPVGSVNLVNTRKGVSATNLGIGPVGRAATPTVAGAAWYPGDLNGQLTKDNYVKPEYKIEYTNISGISAGTAYDIYVLTENRGSVMEWLKFGNATDTTSAVEIYSIYSADSIREANGELQLNANLTPVSSTQSVTWSVANEDGSATTLATIDQNGLLKASGTANGHVIVKAVSGSAEDTLDVMITNQLPANKVTISGSPKTVDYLMMRTGASWSGDSISTYGGSATMGLACKELFSENTNNYTVVSTYLTVPNASATWSISDLEGNPTSLATITQTGVVTATGVDDGKVLVTATLINNPDITAKRVITLSGQGAEKNPYKMIQFRDNNINSTGMGAAASAYASGGNEIGFYSSTTTTARAGFRNVNFKNQYADTFYIRIASTATATVSIWIDGYNEATGGTQVGTLTMPSTGSNSTYKTYTTGLDKTISGVHDLYFVFSQGATRANWFQFTSSNIAIDRDNMDIFVVDGSAGDSENYAPTVSITSKSAVSAVLFAAAYDGNGVLLAVNSSPVTTIAANVEQQLSASIPRNPNAVTYKFFVWNSNGKPLSFTT